MSLVFLTLLMATIFAGGIFYNRTSQNASHVQLLSGPTTVHKAPDSISGTSGKLFTGTVVRSFPENKRKFLFFVPSSQPASRVRRDPWCESWGVVSTVDTPSEAVKRQVRLKDWCLVIVADHNSLKEHRTRSVFREGNTRVVYLTPEVQLSMQNAFMGSIPWNHFGRKNIGYLYAIMHGATIIWDFDGDNMLKFWIPDGVPDRAPSIYTSVPGINNELMEARAPDNHQWPTYNPYPALGAPTLPSWPRGLPLSDVREPLSSNSTLKDVTVQRESVAVLQSIADYQPDVDAIYRLTMPIPFSFTRSDETRPLMIPTGVLSPYNAQATLHFEAAFFGLLLPVTVHSRVSDIWRSYFAQRLLWDTGHQIGFMARPLVVQDGNLQNNLGDLEAEGDLYMKSKHLVDFLGSWRGKGNTVVERMEELWIALYERQYIEAHDVEVLQCWLQSLLSAGYKFPDIKTASIHVPLYPRLDIQGSKYTESCTTDKRLTFWTSDLQDGSRIGIPSQLASLGHRTVVAGIKGNRTPYPSVFRREGISTYGRISPTLKNYTTHSTALSEKMVQDNFDFYKLDRKIASTDVFMCMFPSSMCELWMPFNKTIAFLPDHRYNLGRCTKKEWDRLNEHLYALASMKSPKHIIGAQSIYDVEYLRHYTGLDPIPLYSFTGYYTANNPFNPKRDEILVLSQSWKHLQIAKDLQTQLNKFTVTHVRKLYGRYNLSDLVSHRAIIYLPDSVMSYNFSELYHLAIPLFVPSMKFMQSIEGARFGADRSSLAHPYCKNPHLDSQVKAHPSSTHPYSLNVEVQDDPESEYYWLQFADFFQWPYITYFDDYRDLEEKLGKADFLKIHELMAAEVKRKRRQLLHTWCNSLKRVERGRVVPHDYKQALQKLYGVDRLQVN